LRSLTLNLLAGPAFYGVGPLNNAVFKKKVGILPHFLAKFLNRSLAVRYEGTFFREGFE